MPYTPFHDPWADYPDESTPITAEALDHIEAGIVSAQAAGEAAQTDADAAQAAADAAQADADTAQTTADAAATAAAAAQSTADTAVSDAAAAQAAADAAVQSTSVDAVEALTQAEYDALTPDPATLYFITDAA